MKKIIIILLLSPVFSYGQSFLFPSDSASVKINVTLQARDGEYLAGLISHNETYEDLFDAVKVKFRIEAPPQNNTTIAVNEVEIRTWLHVMNALGKDCIAIQAGVLTRLDALLRAKNNAYINRVLDERISSETRDYINRRQEGRRKLRKTVI